MSMVARWIRHSRRSEAERSDGLTIKLEGFQWVVRLNGKAKILRAEGAPVFFEKAIREVDEAIPPKRWKLAENGDWVGGNWLIRENADGKWTILRAGQDGDFSTASTRFFGTADRARVWCEVRFDRSDAGLRGPKPRAGLRATAKLPDVRVTDEERENAYEILAKAGLSYSEFVRAALRWAEYHLDRGWEVVEDERGPLFAPREPDADVPRT